MPNPIMIAPDPAPGLAKGFANIADLFAPASARDAYYGTEAGLARAKTLSETQKAQRLADVFANRDNPDQAARDRAAISAGLYNPNQGYYAVDTKDATDRRGQDIQSTDKRYDVNSRDSTSRSNNTDNNTRAVIDAIMAPQPEGSSRVIPPEIAAKYGVPAQSNGIVKLQPGQTATLPPGAAGPVAPLQGNEKPLTDAEAKGKIVSQLSPEEQHALGISEIKPRPVFGTANGTATQDPVTNRLKDTQSGIDLPAGTKATNLGAPTTNVNIDSSGNTYGPPEKGFAYVRDADGKIKVGPNGAPMLAPMQGGPEFDKIDKAGKADLNNTNHKNAQAKLVTEDIDRAIAQIQADPTLTAGLGGQLTSGVGGTPGANAKALLDTITANTSLDTLQAMRDASPTGAAMGRVTNQEMTATGQASGNLSQPQSASQLVDNLKRLKDHKLDVIHGGPLNGRPVAGPARSYEKTATLGDRKLIARGGKWIDEATGLPVGTETAP